MPPKKKKVQDAAENEYDVKGVLALDPETSQALSDWYPSFVDRDQLSKNHQVQLKKLEEEGKLVPITMEFMGVKRDLLVRNDITDIPFPRGWTADTSNAWSGLIKPDVNEHEVWEDDDEVDDDDEEEEEEQQQEEVSLKLLHNSRVYQSSR